MRLIHTSDWHLGRSFHRVGMLEHQVVFLDHLVDVVRSERVDVVVVAGDVYDRALPNVETVALLNDAVERIVDTGAQLVLTSGNHDSAERLGFGGRVMERGGVHLRTRVADLARPVVLTDKHGDVGIYGLPYLEPSLVADELQTGRSHEAVLARAAGLARTDLAGRPTRTRSVLAAHAFVVGGELGGSERDISVGGVASVSAAAFDGFDYVALGHLHGRQRLSETVRYSGSPLAYSFGEVAHRKGSWLVDLGPRGVTSVTPVEAPVPRRLAVLRGRLDTLLSMADYTWAESAWCHLTLTDPDRPRAAMERVRARFPHTLVLTFEPEGNVAAPLSYRQRIQGQDPVTVCCEFVEHVRGGGPATSREGQLLRSALEGGRLDQDVADGVDRRQRGVA